MVCSSSTYVYVIFWTFLAANMVRSQTQSHKYVYAHYVSNKLSELRNERSFSSNSQSGWVLKTPSKVSPESSYWESCDVEDSYASAISYLTTPEIKTEELKSENLHLKFSFLVWCESPNLNCNGDRVKVEVLTDGRKTPFEMDISQSHKGSIRSTRTPFPPHTEGIPVALHSSSFQLRISNNDLCIRISEIQIYSIFCPSEVRDLTYYPRTFAPQSPTQNKEVFGECVMNSSQDPDSSLLSSQQCASYGEWLNPYSTCSCNPGYKINSNRTTCTACEPHTYKSEYGNSQYCLDCPPNSDSLVPAASRCPCKPGYFRNLDQESEHSSCATTPTKVREVLYEADYKEIVLRWKPPHHFGGREVVWYRVECDSCPSHPVEGDIRSPFVTLRNLDPGTRYTVTIYSLNSVSKYFNNKNNETVVVETRHAVFPQDIAISNNGPGQLHISWKNPPGFLGHAFCVRITKPGLSTPEEPECVNNSHITLKNLATGTYGLEIGAMVAQDMPVIYSKKHFAQVAEGHLSPLEVTQKQLLLVFGMMTLICLLFLLLCSCAVLMYRKQTACNFNSNLNCKQLSPWNHHPGTMYSTFSSNASPNNQVYNQTDVSTYGAGLKVPIGQAFIEPSFYEDLKQMASEFCTFLDHSNISIQSQCEKELFGSGSEVSVGYLKSYPSYKQNQTLMGTFSGIDSEVPVIVKTLPLSYVKTSGEMQLANFPEMRRLVIEASIMGQLFHPNVQLVHGISSSESQWCLVAELAEVGTLSSFITNTCAMVAGNNSSPGLDSGCGSSPNPKELLTQFIHSLRGIACGMQYLSDIGYVHKVLTSSNVKLNSNLVCKISGFEQRVSLDEVQCGTDEWHHLMDFLAPWSAPEVLQSSKYSSASDVWAFGVIAWELITCFSIVIGSNNDGNGGNNFGASSEDGREMACEQIYSTTYNNSSSSNPPSVDVEHGNTGNGDSCGNGDRDTYNSRGDTHHCERRNSNSIPGRDKDCNGVPLASIQPYFKMTPKMICEFIHSGERLEIPSGCPQLLRNMMIDCWQVDRNARPFFGKLREVLEHLIRQPRLWENYVLTPEYASRTLNKPPQGSYPTEPYDVTKDSPSYTVSQHNSYYGASQRSQLMGASPSPPPLLPHLSLVQWLSHQNLSKYVNLFERNGIRDLQDVITVDGNQLKTIGVDSKKDRKSLINAIQILKDRILSSTDRQSYLKQTQGVTTFGSKGKLACTSPVHSII